jgi:preprotein translocase subunit SecG
MYTVAIILTIIVAVLLALVVLAQAAKGQGLAGGLSSPGGVGAVFGVRRAADFLVKATIYLAGILMFLVLVINLFLVPGGSSAGPSAVQQGPAPTATPAVPAPQTSTPVVPQTTAPAAQAPAEQAPAQQAPASK